MGAFTYCTGILIIFNFITFLLGLNPLFLSPASIIANFTIIGGIIALTALIPFINGGSFQITWIGKVALMISLLFAVNILGFNLGLGLVTNLMMLGSSDINNISCLVFYFPLLIGILALISGIMSLGGGD
jgi:hypothetical protein